MSNNSTHSFSSVVCKDLHAFEIVNCTWQKCCFWVWSVSDVSSQIGLGQRYHLDRHGQFTLKQLRLSVLNEMHTNSYTGPGLDTVYFPKLML